jgi:uncharacterized membrane protein (DUF373 family)
MTIPRRTLIITILTLALCATVFGFATWRIAGLFTETSYKITALFLSLILLSNVMAKICTYTIKRHGTSN